MIFRDLKEEIKFYNRSYLIRKNISTKFEKKGFLFYEPKVFEDYSRANDLIRGFEKSKTIKVLDGNGEIAILRPDITWEIIDKFSKKINLDEEYKIFYDGKIFRKEKNINDGIVNQIGLEWINVKSYEADKKVIAIGADILKEYSESFVIEIGDTEFIDNLMEILSLNPDERYELTQIIKRKNNEDLANWMDGKEFNENIKEVFLDILKIHGNYNKVFESLNGYRYKFIDEILKRLKTIDNLMKKLGFQKDVHYDLSLIPDHEYYEGIIFKGFSKSSFKEILKGGRYSFEGKDNLSTKIFSVGFSIELDELVRE